MRKNTLAIVSILILLFILLIIFISLVLSLTSPIKEAKVENIVDPFDIGNKNVYSGGVVNVYDGAKERKSSGGEQEDEIPPGVISNLSAGEVGTNYISWTWENPNDADFNNSLIYLNGVFITKTSNEFYNATGLSMNTSYTITIHTEDENGNINTQDVNNTQTTLYNSSNPFVTGIPDVTFPEDTSPSYLIDLDDYVTDLDTNISDLIWNYYGNSNVFISMNSENEISFSSTPNWFGQEFITFRATDPDSNFGEQTILVNVTPVNDPAEWETLSDQTIDEDSADGTIVYENIFSKVSDPDSPLVINIISSSSHFDLFISGNDLIIMNLEKDYSGTELVTLDCNGITADFYLTIDSSDDPAEWETLSDQTIDKNSPDGTIVYENIFSKVSDIDSPLVISVVSSSSHFDLFIFGNDLIIVDLEEGYSGTELVTLDCNGITADFYLTIDSSDEPAEWETLSDKTIDEDSADETIIYSNIFSKVSDPDSPLNIQVVSSTSKFNAYISGNHLKIKNLKENWYGERTIVLDCNGVQASFKLTVKQKMDDCVEICSWGSCREYCD